MYIPDDKIYYGRTEWLPGEDYVSHGVGRPGPPNFFPASQSGEQARMETCFISDSLGTSLHLLMPPPRHLRDTCSLWSRRQIVKCSPGTWDVPGSQKIENTIYRITNLHYGSNLVPLHYISEYFQTFHINWKELREVELLYRLNFVSSPFTFLYFIIKPIFLWKKSSGWVVLQWWAITRIELKSRSD